MGKKRYTVYYSHLEDFFKEVVDHTEDLHFGFKFFPFVQEIPFPFFFLGNVDPCKQNNLDIS